MRGPEAEVSRPSTLFQTRPSSQAQTSQQREKPGPHEEGPHSTTPCTHRVRLSVLPSEGPTATESDHDDGGTPDLCRAVTRRV